MRNASPRNQEGIMFRRLILAAALVASAGIYVLAAERATFILTDGERKSGPVVFHGGERENLINGHLNLGVDGGTELTFPIDQVAVIDFVGGQPPTTELQKLGPRHSLVTRDGGVQSGHFVNLIGGDTLLWENEAGQRQQFAIRDVSRVYLNAQSARTAFNYTPPAAPATPAARAPAAPPAGTPAAPRAGTPAATGTTVRVDAREPWTDTGFTVNQGDRLTFVATGQIQVGPSRRDTATPDGSALDQRGSNAGRSRAGGDRRTSQGYPARNVPPGALLGRIGNSAPFEIGSQTQPLTMPASGRLMLGVNDNDFSDNSGVFTVVVAGGRQDGRAPQNWRGRPSGQDGQDPRR
jgi:hypothetical protein